MAKKGPGISDIVHQIVRESPVPLTVDEVAERLAAIAPEASRNPKNSVRNSLSNNRGTGLIRLPDGRIGWKPRLINGATLRHIFYDEDLSERELLVGDALHDLLEPLRGQAQSSGALRLELEGGRSVIGKLTVDMGQWVLDAGPALWDWLESRDAAPGDSLIVTALDGEERRYSLRLEHAAARDEAAIARRNKAILDAAIAILRRQRGRAVIWEIVAHLNASDATHDPIPSDPFEDIWTEEVYGPVQDEYGVDFPLTGGMSDVFADLSEILAAPVPVPVPVPAPATPLIEPVEVEVGPEDVPPGVSLAAVRAKLKAIYGQGGLKPVAPGDPLLPVITPIAARNGLPSPTGKPYKASELQAMFGSDESTIEWIERGAIFGMVELDDAFHPAIATSEEPVDLPSAYIPTGAPRKPQPSPQGRKGPVTTYMLRLTYAGYEGFSRDIEIAEDQNLEDLHLAIQKALGWDDDHLYSFFMGRRPYDPKTEIGSPWSDAARHTHQVTLGSLGLKPKQKFIYLFDYGDSHLFDLQVLKITPQASKGSYPKVVAREGRAPSQYGEE